MAGAWFRNVIHGAALATGLVLMLAPLRAVAQANSAEGICATTSDPASCQQMINSAIGQGGSSPQLSGAGSSGIGSLLQGLGQGQSPTTVPGTIQGPQPSVVVTPSQPTSRHLLARSHLEDIYSKRAGIDLQQFGYDVLGNGSSVSALQIGAVQDQYILGQGDEIEVTLRGQENATYNIFVDRDGNVTLPRLRPISASGRRFGDFRQDLDSAIREGYIQTQDYITIGQVRQISVNVVGEVFSPGVYGLSGLSSVLDALQLAGGVTKTGSLRDITIVRDGHAVHIDLYRFISPGGKMPDTTLRQDDRIVVSPLGPTIAIAGEVQRPGIYELNRSANSATARRMIELANGYTIRGAYRLTDLHTRPDGKLEYIDITGHEGTVLRDGEILIVNSAANYTYGDVTLEGNVRLPGDYALNRVRTLRDLLPSPESFLPLTYTPFAYIIRQDKITLQRKIIPFSVAQLLAGTYNTDLQSLDIIHILTFNAMHQLLAISSAPQNAEGAPVTGLQARAFCRQEDDAIRDLPRPERARSATALKLPKCPAAPGAGTPQPVTTATGSLAQMLASSALGQTPSSTLFAGQQASQRQQPGFNSTSPLNAFQPGASGTFASPGGLGAADIGSATGPGDDTSALSAFAGSSGKGNQGPPSDTGASADEGLSGVEGVSADEASTLGFVVGDYRVSLEGGVRAPGNYLAAPGVSLGELVDAANGLLPDADLNAVEITSVAIDNEAGHSTATRKLYALTPEKLASIPLKRLDVVEIPHVPSELEDGYVLLDGEVHFPGTYHILKGEKLSSLLTRAGGLTRLAYPQGAVFQRPSVARVQESAYDREADDLQEQLMASVAQGGGVLASAAGQSLGLSPEAAGFVEDVIGQLRAKPADGRISIIADPVALAADPQADIQLQPGDRLYIPKRPSEVMVTGEVLSPGNYRYAPKLGAADYIALSGGNNRYADDDHIFVINPDGTARGISDNLFNFTKIELAPGSVVVVPRNLKPLDLGALTVTVAKVFSDFAISAASIAVLAHTD